MASQGEIDKVSERVRYEGAGYPENCAPGSFLRDAVLLADEIERLRAQLRGLTAHHDEMHTDELARLRAQVTEVQQANTAEVERRRLSEAALINCAGWQRIAETNEARAFSAEAKVRELEASWRCFHCDERFTDATLACEHFGTRLLSEPACAIDIAKFRAMEEMHRRHCEEDTDLDRKFHHMRAEAHTATQRAEEGGYAKGVAEGRTYFRDQLTTAERQLAEAREIIGQLLHRRVANAESQRARHFLAQPAPAAEAHGLLDALANLEAAEAKAKVGPATSAHPTAPGSQIIDLMRALKDSMEAAGKAGGK